MKEKPILFSTPMVRAILEGRKTITRRVVKPQPKHNPPKIQEIWNCTYEVGMRLWVRETWRETAGIGIQYRATDEDNEDYIWRPSIFMPRLASRITLEVTNVRIERLQDISEFDAISEGINPTDYHHSPITEFKSLWDSINAKRSFGWDSNPYVWVIEFKKL